MIRAIIFDCFGVIITDALQVICDEVREHDPQRAAQIREYVRAANKGLITPKAWHERIAKILGITPNEYRQRIADGEVKDERLLSFIATLRPKYKTAMLSNITHEGLSRRFATEELKQCFDVVVTSGDIGFAKPEPQAYEITAEKLGVRLGECIFIDDREGYCEAARGVGMQAIRYQNFTQMRHELKKLLANAEN